MSIEQAIIDNTAALNRLIAVYTAMAQQPAAPVGGAVVGQITAAPAAAPVAAAPQMPAPPTFTMPPPAPAPVAPPAPAGAPFNDAKGLMDYAMDAYTTMGAAKGSAIQGVLTSLGHANMNDVRPDQYGAFYAGVEALKRG